eukprot:350993-Alexandrium_andersonii.AAC.1
MPFRVGAGRRAAGAPPAPVRARCVAARLPARRREREDDGLRGGMQGPDEEPDEPEWVETWSAVFQRHF